MAAELQCAESSPCAYFAFSREMKKIPERSLAGAALYVKNPNCHLVRLGLDRLALVRRAALFIKQSALTPSKWYILRAFTFHFVGLNLKVRQPNRQLGVVDFHKFWF